MRPLDTFAHKHYTPLILATHGRENEMTTQLETLCKNLGITCNAVYIGRGTGEWSSATQYKVTLRFQGRQLTTPFYMGAALTRDPDAAGVLYCLAADARAGDGSFADFCSDFGCDPDSRKAEATWKACVKVAPKLRRFLGEHFDDVCNTEH